MSDHGQLVPADEDLHGRADAPTDRISIAWARDYVERFQTDKYLHVRPRELSALLAALATARDLTDLAAHVVCEPRRFLNNEDNVQQLLGECVARAREALAPFQFDHQSNEPAASDAGHATGSSTEKGV